MGVYFFECGESGWVKVGHHRLTASRPNVYYRVARRGFGSCRHPAELSGKLAADDVRLVAWFPSLTRRDEGRLHRLDPTRVGEFHRAFAVPALLAEARRLAGSDSVAVSDADRRRAMSWAGKHDAV